MRKNTASQVIGAQMVSASDGSAFTGSVTVSVTGDGGTQATGSVGSGACTHEGNGYHTYTPSQAETNYNLVAFTFTGSGAVPVTIQIYTESINRHDTVRLGLTALPNAAANDAGGLVISGAGGLDIDAKLAVATSALATPTNITAGTITTVTNLTNLPTIPANWLTASGLATDAVTEIQSGLATASSLATVAGYLDTEIAAILAVINKVDTALESDGAAGYQFTILALENAPSGSGASASAIADAVWDEALSGHATAGTAGKAAADAAALLTTALADAYAAHGNAPTLQQAIMWIHQSLDERSASGTTITVKKIDGTTAGTLTVNDADDPTSITRAT